MAYLRDPDITEKAPSNSISILLPKIFNYRIKFLGFQNQELTFQEYKYLTLNDKCQVVFTDCKITENKFIVPAEKLLQASPNLCQFSLYFDINKELSYCTSLTSKKLAEFPPFKYLKHFVLYNLSGNFNALHFVEFIKKNYQNGNGSCAKFGVSFKENVSHQFIQNFKSVVNSSVISMKDVKREHIFFNGQT
uniref:Uncharacterized protein n=1 Tax=Panagrolaimus superbus TaxID=310955 RepID=A0A914YQI1_9BILA